jgi:hypothetical protein
MYIPHRLASRAIVMAVACILGAAAASAAGQASAATPSRLNAVEQKTRDAVLARFRALSIQNGIVLVPLSRVDGVESIEIRGGTIAINGRAVTGDEVRARLGRDAEPVLQLSYFDLAAQQRMLLPPGLPEPPAGAGRPEAVPPQPSAPSEPVEPQGPSMPERTFRREYDARVRLFGDITVEQDEQVNGAVVAIGGSITVDGRVRDNVVAVGGDVKLGPHAEVRGDVTTVGGTIERDPGAIVSGRLNEVGVSTPGVHIRPNWDVRWARWPSFTGPGWSVVRLFGTMLRMAVFALFAALIVLVAPRAVQRVEHAVTSQPWKSALVGLLAQLFFIPVLILVIVVLAISIVGIPLLILVPFGVIAFFLAFLLGFTGAACGLARLIWRRRPVPDAGMLTVLGVGLVVIWSFTLLGRIVGLGGGPLMAAAVGLILVGVLIEYAAWTIGLGGALLTRFGRYGALPPAPPVMAPAVASAPTDAGEPPVMGL